MVSIEIAAVPSPRDALREAAEWTRVIVATLARGLVATLLGLALWAAAPAVIGWHPTTVMTGSMEPRLTPGDVVVSRPVAPEALRQGQVLLYDDPDQPGDLRMHRFIRSGADGTIITKGDANESADSTPVARSAVHGVGFIRVPSIGAPIVWMRDGEWHRVVLLALVLTVVLWLATIDGSLRRLATAAEDADDTDDRLEARGGPDPSLPSDTATVSRRELRKRARRARRLARIGGALMVLVLAGGAGMLLPAKASAAAFNSTAKATTSFTAGSVTAPSSLTCTTNSDRSVTVGWTYSGTDAASSFDVLSGSSAVSNQASSSRSVRLTTSGSGSYSISVRTNTSTSWTATSATAVALTATNGTLRCA